MCTEEQAPKDPCPVHSGYAPTGLTSAPSADGILRARVLEPQALTPIDMKQPTVVGQDPYGSNLILERMNQLAGVGNAQAPLITTNEVPVGGSESPMTDVPAPRPIIAPPPPTADVKLGQPEPLKFD
jgi:hypothetical protein